MYLIPRGADLGVLAISLERRTAKLQCLTSHRLSTRCCRRCSWRPRMLPRTLSRVARSIPSNACTPAVLCSRSAHSQRHQPGHQRRPSSSKASYPPGGPRNSEAATDAGAKSATRTSDDERSASGRQGRKKSKDALAAADRATIRARDEAFAHLPSVPSTGHLQLAGEWPLEGDGGGTLADQVISRCPHIRLLLARQTHLRNESNPSRSLRHRLQRHIQRTDTFQFTQT